MTKLWTTKRLLFTKNTVQEIPICKQVQILLIDIAVPKKLALFFHSPHNLDTCLSPPHGIFPDKLENPLNFICYVYKSESPNSPQTQKLSLLFHLPIRSKMSPAKFLIFVVVFHLKSAADDIPTPISCANCSICPYLCHPPPDPSSPTYGVPPPPQQIAEPQPLPVPVAPANCPPTVVQCCQFSPPPPGGYNNNNIYTPLSEGCSFLKLGLVSVLAPVLALAAIFSSF